MHLSAILPNLFLSAPASPLDGIWLHPPDPRCPQVTNADSGCASCQVSGNKSRRVNPWQLENLVLDRCCSSGTVVCETRRAISCGRRPIDGSGSAAARKPAAGGRRADTGWMAALPLEPPEVVEGSLWRASVLSAACIESAHVSRNSIRTRLDESSRCFTGSRATTGVDRACSGTVSSGAPGSAASAPPSGSAPRTEPAPAAPQAAFHVGGRQAPQCRREQGRKGRRAVGPVRASSPAHGRLGRVG